MSFFQNLVPDLVYLRTRAEHLLDLELSLDCRLTCSGTFGHCEKLVDKHYISGCSKLDEHFITRRSTDLFLFSFAPVRQS